MRQASPRVQNLRSACPSFSMEGTPGHLEPRSLPDATGKLREAGTTVQEDWGASEPGLGLSGDLVPAYPHLAQHRLAMPA